MTIRKDSGDDAVDLRRDRQPVRVRFGDGLARGFTHQFVRTFPADFIK